MSFDYSGIGGCQKFLSLWSKCGFEVMSARVLKCVVNKLIPNVFHVLLLKQFPHNTNNPFNNLSDFYCAKFHTN